MSEYKEVTTNPEIANPGLLTVSSITSMGRMMTIFSFYLSRDTIDKRRYTMFSYKHNHSYNNGDIFFYRDFFYSDERILANLQGDIITIDNNKKCLRYIQVRLLILIAK